MRCYLLNKNCHLQSNKRVCSIGVQTQAAGAGGSLLQASSWIIRVTELDPSAAFVLLEPSGES